MGYSVSPSLSIRLLWPFARLMGWTDLVVRYSGCTAEEFANPETRIARTGAMHLLELALQHSGDPALGLRAAELTEAHDFDVLEYAARSAPTLGDAIGAFIRFSQLMDDAIELSLDREGPVAILRFQLRPQVTQPPSASEFMIAGALAFSRRNTATYEAPVELHFRHAPPPYAEEYTRVFGCPIRFHAPCDAIVMTTERLSVPMARSNPVIANAFELHAQKLLTTVQKADGLSGKIRRLLLEMLRRGPVSMNEIARREGMAVATMRRRLRDESTTFAELLEEVRRDLSRQYLRDSSLTLTEIAFLLGYSNVTSFTRAFQRWTHTTPGAYRQRERGSSSTSNLQSTYSGDAH